MTHENKLGMFIHWGLYALTGEHEQVLARLNLDRAEYEGLKDRFNPTEYDPEKWVLLAKEAGMKYLCFTAKQHDGFCMWDTAFTDYNIMNTPYGKDTLRLLADACHKHGILLSLYYSNPDWHHEYGYNSASSHQWRCVQKEKEDTLLYREFIKNQITELLTNYGPVYTLFWDIPPKVEDESLNALVRRLQPNIYINDRGWSKGDFSTPERDESVIQEKPFEHMVEACNSVGQQSWGYRAKEDFYTVRYLTSSIDRIMSRGGSYILNVGPDALGRIPEDYARRIRKVGDWYNRMEGCLESALPDDFDYKPTGSKWIATKKNGKTYLHFREGLVSSAVSLKAYPSIPKSVRLMNTGKQLPFEETYLPAVFNGKTGRCEEKVLHIWSIPMDDLVSEPIVLEILW